jgi:tetratricopeptide (TPR) repeat protein
MNQNTTARPADGWLSQAYPEVHHMLLALEGSEESLDWLKENSKGFSILTRAMTGRPKALAALHAEEPAELDDLFEVIDNDDLSGWLRERQPDVHCLFAAIRGETGAMSDLKHHRRSLTRLAMVIRELYQTHLQHQRDGNHGIEGQTAADMGCLIGEMHLKAGEYDKAIEAFSRALGSKPEADVYEGRARAYRALAEADERRARELRHGR